MMMFFLQPGRADCEGQSTCVVVLFSSLLWKEYATIASKRRWLCDVDLEMVKVCFPSEYDAAVAKFPNLRQMRFGCCGFQYRPWKDGAAMLLELKVDDVWVPILSELLPEHIVDRLMLAQAEWYKVTQMLEAKATQLEIAKHATHPSTCLIEGLPFHLHRSLSVQGVLRERSSSCDASAVGEVLL